MYLRYLQLDLPYRENPETLKSVMTQHNCTYEDAIRIDYEENWMKSIRRRFELETRCIASMFIRLLGKYKTKDCSKICISCVEKVTRANYDTCMGICLVEYKLDYVDFFSKNDYEKKKIIFQIIKESISNIAKEKSWELIPLQEVFNKMEELSYNNFWTFGKKAKSPDKLYTAELYIEHKIGTIDFFAVIRNNQDEIVEKKLIISEIPSEYAYTQHLGKLVWVSDTEIHLNDKTGFTLFSIHLN
ncbi:hypothetical protein OXPF_31640 [Oxobacter pfennigii]|uniref:Uncharacterized protein n=1 Tax=Oxobacter pfennigii TaxID=36849 RepID=A0A0P8Y921_9CLOT|nr:hypothetical protein [Oxobacter pfennigii]KPU43270.1 hypothetical protein OXPF_31640 [Oxobacter pfennigii]